jgi:lysophospholipase L1-like esterase
MATPWSFTVTASPTGFSIPYTEAYVSAHFPQLRVRFIHSGWGGDRVSGGAGGPIDQRLDRDVFAYRPTVVTILLGMNDGGYSSRCSARASRRFL